MENKTRVVIVAPSLDVSKNVSGVSAVTRFIINHNMKCTYSHFQQGKGDDEVGKLSAVIRLLRTYREWARLLKRGDFDILHYNFPLDALSVVRDFFFIRLAYRMGKRMVIHIHGGLYLFEPKKPFLVRALLNRIFSWRLSFIVLSHRERERLEQDYRVGDVHVLPNCVEIPDDIAFQNRPVKDSLHFLYLGRIEPNKGMDYLYEAMEKWKTMDANFVLHMAGIEQGTSAYVERFQQLLGSRFVYEGVVSGEGKTNLLKRCQVFLLPSLYEGLPMSMLECMAYGMVPVVTNVGSIGEYVENGRNGFLIETKDAEAIVDALQRLKQEPSMRNAMSEAARATILASCSPQQYIAELNKIYVTTV